MSWHCFVRIRLPECLRKKFALCSGDIGSPIAPQSEQRVSGGGGNFRDCTRPFSDARRMAKSLWLSGRKLLSNSLDCRSESESTMYPAALFHIAGRQKKQFPAGVMLEFRQRTHGAAVFIPFRTSGAATWLDAHRRHRRSRTWSALRSDRKSVV